MQYKYLGLKENRDINKWSIHCTWIVSHKVVVVFIKTTVKASKDEKLPLVANYIL